MQNAPLLTTCFCRRWVFDFEAIASPRATCGGSQTILLDLGALLPATMSLAEDALAFDPLLNTTYALAFDLSAGGTWLLSVSSSLVLQQTALSPDAVAARIVSIRYSSSRGQLLAATSAALYTVSGAGALSLLKTLPTASVGLKPGAFVVSSR